MLTVVAAPMIGVAPTSAVAPSTVPCGQLGTVTASASPRQCVLAAGEAIEFVIVAGNGGNGGVAGPGGGGCSGEDNGGNGVAGGFGGGGGLGGAGGRGAAVTGTYANNTGSPMTLEVVVGANGTNGAIGAPGGSMCASIPGFAQDGNDGLPGTNGTAGTAGGPATISALSLNGPASLIVAAFGGAGGTGGTGGAGGQGGRSTGTTGANGAPGAFGTAGAAGSTDPGSLPTGMSLLLGDGNPRVTFTAVAPAAPAVVLPPGIGDLVTQPIVSATTLAPGATTVPPTTEPPTTEAPTTTVPTPVPFEGALPELVPGAGQVSEGGVATPVELFVEDRTDLVLQGDDFELRLTGECAAGCLIETTQDGRAVLTLEQGGSARVSGEGFMPGSPVFVWLFSEPRFLGELTVGADGTFTGVVFLGDIEVGEHTLQANGTSADGVARSTNLGVLVEAAGVPGPGTGELPSTGSAMTPLVLVSMLLLGLGAVVIGCRTRIVR